jgi:hypothetical protein
VDLLYRFSFDTAQKFREYLIETGHSGLGSSCSFVAESPGSAAMSEPTG